MPLYEYRCAECETNFEILQRMGEGADDLKCPGCGSGEVAKQFSTFAAATSTGSLGRGTAAGGGCGVAGGSGFR